MNIADKIKKFDNMLPANVEQFENLFKVDLFRDKNELVEILEPICGNLRKVKVGNDILNLDLMPVSENRFSIDYLRKKRKYIYRAYNMIGVEIASGYSRQEIASQLGVTPTTISNKLKNVNKKQRKHKNGMFTVIKQKL